MNNKSLTKGVGKHTTIFYRRLLGYLIQENNISKVNNIIENMFVLMNIRYLFDQVSIGLKNEMCTIANEHKIDNETECNGVIELDDFDVSNNYKNKFQGFIKSLCQRAHDSLDIGLNSSDTTLKHPENIYYAPDLEKPIIEFLSMLPMSGNIMNRCHKSKNEKASSSPTENDFNVLKNDLFKKSKNMRIDEWLRIHIKFTKGRLTGKRARELIAFCDNYVDDFDNSEDDEANNVYTRKPEDSQANNNQFGSRNTESNANMKAENRSNYSTSSEYFDSNEEEDEYASDSLDEKLNKYENFRGLADEITKPGKRIKRCASSILNPVKNCKANIPILSNGYTNPTGNPKVVTENTCAFDSVFQVFAASYIDVHHFDNIIKDNAPTHLLCDMICTLFDNNSKQNSVYIKRNKLLLEYFTGKPFLEKITKNLISINCHCTFDYIFQKICKANPFLNSVKQIKQCVECDEIIEEKHLPYVPIKTNREDFKIADLQSMIPCMMLKSKQRCDKCSKLFSIYRELNSVIVIDIDNPVISSEMLEKNHKNDYLPIKKVQISDIPGSISCRSNNYRIFGIIERRAIADGHYVAYIKREDEWNIYDDISNQKPKNTTNASVLAVALFYVLIDPDTTESLEVTGEFFQTNFILYLFYPLFF